MLRGIARGLGLLLIVVGGIILGQGVGLIVGSFMTGHGRWAVTGGVMIAIGICLLAAGHVSRPGSEAMTELDEIRADQPPPQNPHARQPNPPTNPAASHHGARGGPLQLRRGSAHPDRLRSRGLRRRS
jgi:LDH2 family malate/lactate/ureidoglycolate dehydrogenase